MANAAAQGQGSAYAQGSAEQRSLKARERGVEEGKKIEGKEKRVDHLGIEA
jgi:hypothetical protein